MKLLSKILLALYMLVLLWLLLFKFTSDLSIIIGNTQSLNLLPFAAYSRTNPIEMILNLCVFIPFGLLLSANLKQASIWQKLAGIFVFSLAVEVIQFMLAVGVADITDIIMNTAGGFLGLILYELSKRWAKEEKVDQLIVVASSAVLVPAILLFGILLSQGFEYRSGTQAKRDRLRGTHQLPPADSLPN